jgi:hypothetical protein
VANTRKQYNYKEQERNHEQRRRQAFEIPAVVSKEEKHRRYTQERVEELPFEKVKSIMVTNQGSIFTGAEDHDYTDAQEDEHAKKKNEVGRFRGPKTGAHLSSPCQPIRVYFKLC